MSQNKKPPSPVKKGKHLPSMRDRLFVRMQYLLPHHFLSAIIFHITHSKNKILKRFLIDQAIKRFDIDISIAMNSDPDSYASFNEFFTGELRPDARPVNNDPRALCCPVDGVASQFGKIRKGQLVQAKGHTYSLEELLGGDKLWTRLFQDGEFMTIYLAPRDYHRIHSPRHAILKRTLHIPGKLFSVNPITTRAVPNLFSRNERLCCLFESDLGPMAVIMVGAIFVSSIETVWGGEHVTPSEIQPSDFGPPALSVKTQKGEELGRFNMGSTVILLFGKDRICWSEKLKRGIKVKLGQPIGMEKKAD